MTTVNFVTRENGPERLETEAELIFGDDAGPLSGMKLVGFSLWRSPDGEVYVTFPARAFGPGSERRYFDYLRPTDPVSSIQGRNLKAWILEQFRAWKTRQDLPMPSGVSEGTPSPRQLEGTKQLRFDMLAVGDRFLWLSGRVNRKTSASSARWEDGTAKTFKMKPSAIVSAIVMEPGR